MKVHAVQYTVRGVPDDVDRALRERAVRQNMSINQLIIEELTKATIGRRKAADFSDMVGRWNPDTEFDAIIEGQRDIHAEDWA